MLEMITSRINAQLIDTAYHEAGHAVAALSCGVSVEFVTIIPKDGDDGFAKMVGKFDVINKVFDSSEDIIQALKERMIGFVIMLFAGHVTVLELNKILNLDTYREDSFFEDFIQADFLVDRIITEKKRDLGLYSAKGAPEKAASRLWATLDKKTTNIVQSNWQAISSVAEQLFIKQTLTGNEIKSALINASDFQADVWVRGALDKAT